MCLIDKTNNPLIFQELFPYTLKLYACICVCVCVISLLVTTNLWSTILIIPILNLKNTEVPLQVIGPEFKPRLPSTRAHDLNHCTKRGSLNKVPQTFTAQLHR